MYFLVINCGSSSLKYKLVETSQEQITNNSDRVVASGCVEDIGQDVSRLRIVAGELERDTKIRVEDHHEALEKSMNLLEGADSGPLCSLDQLDAIGHRVVHGGELLSESVIIDDKVEKQIEECIQFAPLHNPHNLEGIRAAREHFPELPQVAAFDTGVHQTLPEKAYTYAIPWEYYEEHGIRRYGFHGLSHRYLRLRTAQLMDTTTRDIQVVTCHLGNGASLAAFDGKVVEDTSMGFTPLEGLVMGTRSGDLDPAVVTYIMSLKDYSREEIDEVLNSKSGLLGLSGQTNDMRTLLNKSAEGDERAELAIKVFCHRLKKYICAYHGLLNGADAIVFSGGIGENAHEIRQRSLSDLNGLGISADFEASQNLVGQEGRFTSKESGTELFVIPTNEELMIARDCVGCLN